MVAIGWRYRFLSSKDMDEIEAGSLDSETAGRLPGETWVAALVRSR